MGLLGYCTPNLLTSLNGIIGVLHPEPSDQSQWDYWGAAPQNSSPVSIVIFLFFTPQHLPSLKCIFWRLPPHTSSPLSMGLLGCCTPNLLTSLNRIIGVLHPKPPHQSQWDYWGTAPQTSSLV